MSILVLNAGSTSLKFAVFDTDARESLLTGSLDWSGGQRTEARMIVASRGAPGTQQTVSVCGDDAAARLAIAAASAEHSITLIGHRVVHGGEHFGASAMVDDAVKAAVARLCALAPLHNPPALAAMHAAESLLPGVPQVAVFDTAFFARLPERAVLYPLPYEWRKRFGVRRFGFHGISNAWCAERAAEMLAADQRPLRIITCHLGGGCSATAVRGGEPVATTMGFSPLDGLMMGSRPGSMDPGLLLHLLREGGVSVGELDQALNHQSGLLGISGIAPDLAPIESAAQRGDARAKIAWEMFADRVRGAIGSLAVQMNGLDALIFTDRIGEGSPALRASVCEGLQCLGVRLDVARNRANPPDADIAAADSAVHVLVLRTREEWMIAREASRMAGR